MLAPAHEVISYVPVTFNVEDTPGESSPFAGPPRKELDEAWHDLLQCMFMRRSFYALFPRQFFNIKSE